MPAVLEIEREPILAPDTETQAIQQLEAALSGQTPGSTIPRLIGPKGEDLPLPLSVYTLLRHLV